MTVQQAPDSGGPDPGGPDPGGPDPGGPDPGGSDLDVAIDGEILRIYRILAAIFIVLYPSFGALHQATAGQHNDPMTLRLGVATAVFSVFAASFLSAHVRRNFYAYIGGLGYLISTHLLYLLHVNHFAYDYVIGYFLILTVMSLLFIELWAHVAYLLYMLAATFLAAQPFSEQTVNLPVLFGAAITFGLVSCVSLSLRLQITHELRRTNRSLAAARDASEAASRAKSVFLANMSHELRTPLNSVIGFAGVMLKDRAERTDAGERNREYLSRIDRNGRHLLELIDEILDLSRIEAGRLVVAIEPVDLLELVRDIHSGMVPEFDGPVSLRLDVPASLDRVTADPKRLRQVLLNLLSNARKFTAEGAVTIRITADGNRPRTLEVEDTGIGIPTDRLEQVFEAFRQVDTGTQRKYGGTGLGLAISQRLCGLMRFELAAESVLGRGSVFVIDLQTDARATSDS